MSLPKRRASEATRGGLNDADIKKINASLLQCETAQHDLLSKLDNTRRLTLTESPHDAGLPLRRIGSDVLNSEAHERRLLNSLLAKRDEELTLVMCREEVQVAKLRRLIAKLHKQIGVEKSVQAGLRQELFEEKRSSSRNKESLLLDLRADYVRYLAELQETTQSKRHMMNDDLPSVCSHCFESFFRAPPTQQKHKERSDLLSYLNCCERKLVNEMSSRVMLLEQRLAQGGKGGYTPSTNQGMASLKTNLKDYL